MDKWGHDVDTPEKRWNDAVREIREHGIKFRRNVMKCCRSCIELSDLGLKEGSTVPYAYTFGGQGLAWKWFLGVPVLRRTPTTRSSARVMRTWIYFGSTVETGDIVYNAMKNAGLPVEWDGTMSSAIEVRFPEMSTNSYLS